jgi:hypothetical protein
MHVWFDANASNTTSGCRCRTGNPRNKARSLTLDSKYPPEECMAARKKAAKKAARKKVVKRELINTGTNKLFVRRNARGTSFTEVTDVGKSLARDRRTKAKRTTKSGLW